MLSEVSWPQKENDGVFSHFWDLTRRQKWSCDRREGKRSIKLRTVAPSTGAKGDKGHSPSPHDSADLLQGAG